MHKKAQFWYADFLLAILILVGISFLFITNINNLNSKQDVLQSLSSDSITISNSFMSEGYCPSGNLQDDCKNDWSSSDGELEGSIGFVSNGKVEQNNLVDFINLIDSTQGYEDSKILLGTRNDYIFYFEDANNDPIEINNINFLGKTVYGNPVVTDISEINAESFVRTTRLVYLDNVNTKSIVKLIIIVW